VHAGIYRDLQQAVGETVQVAETVAPDAASAVAYRRQVEQYRRLYPALAPLREL
jgi:sugar (pentulose or hexulose) kinase